MDVFHVCHLSLSLPVLFQVLTLALVSHGKLCTRPRVAVISPAKSPPISTLMFAATGYYYVLGGGTVVTIARSTDLRHWEETKRPVFSPSKEDCVVAAQMWAHFSPSAVAEARIQKARPHARSPDPRVLISCTPVVLPAVVYF